jgi:hypothetical protein
VFKAVRLPTMDSIAETPLLKAAVCQERVSASDIFAYFHISIFKGKIIVRWMW